MSDAEIQPDYAGEGIAEVLKTNDGLTTTPAYDIVVMAKSGDDLDCISAAQQETNRKILEDLQLKRQLLQKGVNPVTADINNLSSGGGSTSTTLSSSSLGQMLNTQLSSDFAQNSSTTSNTVPRTVFNPTGASTLGYFLPQDSHYGNSYIPVLPRLDPLPPNHISK